MKQLLAFFPVCLAFGVDPFFLSGIMKKIAEYYNISEDSARLSIAIFTFSYALAIPIITAIFTKTSAKKYLLVSISAGVLGNILIIVTSTPFFLFFGNAIAGAGVGIFTTLAMDTAPRLVDSKHRGKAISFISGSLGVGSLMGMPLTIYLANNVDWRLPVLIFPIILGSIGFVSLFFLLDDNLHSTNQGTLKERLLIARNPKILQIIIVTMLFAIISIGLYSFIEKIFEDSGNNSDLSIVSFFWSLGGISAAYSIGFIIDKTQKPRLVMLGGVVLITIAIAILNPLLSHGYWIMISMVIWGAIGWSLLAPQQDMLRRIVPPQYVTGVIGIIVAGNYLGGTIGTIIGNNIMSIFNVGTKTLITVTAIYGIFVILAQIFVIRKNKKFDASGEYIKISK